MENPYAPIRKRASDTLAKLRCNVGDLWQKLEEAMI